MNSVNYDKEFECHVSQYNFLIRNYQGGGIHIFHSLINSEYEQVVRYENLKSQTFRRAVTFYNELRKFEKYYLKEDGRSKATCKGVLRGLDFG